MEKKPNPKKELCIIYHSFCYDGILGAINTYLYYNYFKKDQYNIHFRPQYNYNPIFDVVDKIYDKIVILDLGMKDEDINFLLDTKNINIPIILFDHHIGWFEKYVKEYKDKLKDRKKTKIFLHENNDKSACGISFDYYKNKIISKNGYDSNLFQQIFNDNLNEINIMIEDCDTGNNKIKNSVEFKAGLSQYYNLKSTDLTYNYEQKIKKFLDITPSYLIKVGETSLKKIKKQSKNVLRKNTIYLVELKEGNKFLMCFLEEKYLRNYAGPLLGNISRKKGFLPIGAFVYSNTNGLYQFSMRTNDDSCDVSKIANIYGGGGHKKAAGFPMKLEDIKNLICKKINILNDIETTSFY